MANKIDTIKIRRSTTVESPDGADLNVGELNFSYVNNTLYIGNPIPGEEPIVVAAGSLAANTYRDFSNNAVYYVSKNSATASDNVNNTGQDPNKPFLTIERAIIQGVRETRRTYTVLVLPGTYRVLNGIGKDLSQIVENSPGTPIIDFNKETVGGIIVPTGCSILVLNPQSTFIYPSFVPDAVTGTETAVFLVDKDTQLQGLHFRDRDFPETGDTTAYTSDDHSKLFCIGTVESTDVLDLYEKVDKAYNAQGSIIDALPDPNTGAQINIFNTELRTRFNMNGIKNANADLVLNIFNSEFYISRYGIEADNDAVVNVNNLLFSELESNVTDGVYALRALGGALINGEDVSVAGITTGAAYRADGGSETDTVSGIDVTSLIPPKKIPLTPSAVPIAMVDVARNWDYYNPQFPAPTYDRLYITAEPDPEFTLLNGEVITFENESTTYTAQVIAAGATVVDDGGNFYIALDSGYAAGTVWHSGLVATDLDDINTGVDPVDDASKNNTIFAQRIRGRLTIEEVIDTRTDDERLFKFALTSVGAALDSLRGYHLFFLTGTTNPIYAANIEDQGGNVYYVTPLNTNWGTTTPTVTEIVPPKLFREVVYTDIATNNTHAAASNTIYSASVTTAITNATTMPPFSDDPVGIGDLGAASLRRSSQINLNGSIFRGTFTRTELIGGGLIHLSASTTTVTKSLWIGESQIDILPDSQADIDMIQITDLELDGNITVKSGATITFEDNTNLNKVCDGATPTTERWGLAKLANTEDAILVSDGNSTRGSVDITPRTDGDRLISASVLGEVFKSKQPGGTDLTDATGESRALVRTSDRVAIGSYGIARLYEFATAASSRTNDVLGVDEFLISPGYTDIKLQYLAQAVSREYVNESYTGTTLPLALTRADSFIVGDDFTDSTTSGVDFIAIGSSVELGGGGDAISIGGTSKALADLTVALGGDAEARQNDTTAIGNSAIADGLDATALGYSADATADNTLAVGNLSSASSTNATALGGTANASGTSSVAVGYAAAAAGLQAIAIGRDSTATVDTSLAVGNNADASAINAVSIGNNAEATGLRSVAVGFEADATAQEATAVGDNAVADSTNATAIGDGAMATATDAVSVGSAATASAIETVSVGTDSIAAGVGSIAVGHTATADLADAVAIGEDANSEAAGSITLGAGAAVTGGGSTNAMSIGLASSATGVSAMAIGVTSTANQTKAVAVGPSATSSGLEAVAVGGSSTASGQQSVAIGEDSSSSGNESIAIGDTATATGDQAIAIGLATSSTAAIAIGDTAVASTNATVVGRDATGSGTSSIAIGTSTDAVGDNSIAIGNVAQAVQVIGTVTNNISIGEAATSNAANAIAIGGSASATAAVTTNQGLIAIGASASSTANRSVVLGASSSATADDAVALGPNATASSTNAIAVGDASAASNTNTIALGVSTTASNTASVAIGVSATSSGVNSISIGSSSTANSTSSTAVGVSAVANNTEASAFGASADAGGNSATAMGINSDAAGDRSVAVGHDSNASGAGSIAVGDAAQSTAANTTAVGDAANASQAGTVAVGNAAAASGVDAIGIGNGASAGFADAIAIGAGAAASQSSAIAIGESTVASADDAVALGFDAVASAAAAIAIGDTSEATVADTIAIGRLADAKATQGIAIGLSATIDSTSNESIAIGDNAAVLTSIDSIAIGKTATARADNSICIGDNADTTSVAAIGGIAIGLDAAVNALQGIAIGTNSDSSGTNGVAIGLNSVASAANTTAVGSDAEAVAASSTALGDNATITISGTGAVAVGKDASVLNSDAIAIGNSSTASGAGSVAIGGASNATATGAVMLGDGTNSDAETLKFGTEVIAIAVDGVRAKSAGGAPGGDPGFSGVLYYDTTNNELYVFNDTDNTWRSVAVT